MTPTVIAANGLAADAGRAQAALSRISETTVRDRAYLRAYFTIHCNGTAEVDDIARQWGTRARWVDDQYATEADDGPVLSRAVFIPRPVAPLPLRTESERAA